MVTYKLNDPNIKPSDETVFSIIGDKKLLWQQTLAYLNDNHKNISEVWKYYNDGKSWLFRTLKKKKTIFWIRVLDDTFKIAFYFANRLEPHILESDLANKYKSKYKKAKHFNKSRCIDIDMQDSNDLESVKVLIDLKLTLK